MVADGMMDRFGIDEVYGMHNMPGIPVGEFAIRPGVIMASTDEITIRMGVDRTNEITSTKAAADDDALLGYLDGGASLAVTVTPYSEVPVSVSFDLTGFAASLDELRKACSS